MLSIKTIPKMKRKDLTSSHVPGLAQHSSRVWENITQVISY